MEYINTYVVSEKLVSLCFAAAFLSHFLFFPMQHNAQRTVDHSSLCCPCSGTTVEQWRPCLVLCVLSGEEGCDKVHLLLSEVLPGSTRPSQFSLLLLSFPSPSSTMKKCSVQSETDCSSDSGCNGWHEYEILILITGI